MLKRVLLFAATNIAILLAISIVLSLLGIGGYRLSGGGLDYGALMVFCLLWGMVGSFISLQLSRWMAKRMTGMQLVNGRSGHEEADWVYRTVERLAWLLTHIIPFPVMLLAANRRSTGIGVRPREYSETKLSTTSWPNRVSRFRT